MYSMATDNIRSDKTVSWIPAYEPNLMPITQHACNFSVKTDVEAIHIMSLLRNIIILYQIYTRSKNNVLVCKFFSI